MFLYMLSPLTVELLIIQTRKASTLKGWTSIGAT